MEIWKSLRKLVDLATCTTAGAARFMIGPYRLATNTAPKNIHTDFTTVSHILNTLRSYNLKILTFFEFFRGLQDKSRKFDKFKVPISSRSS